MHIDNARVSLECHGLVGRVEAAYPCLVQPVRPVVPPLLWICAYLVHPKMAEGCRVDRLHRR